ncbi:MAG: anthranilate synthase, component [Bacteroidota bacterium]
MKLLLIDNYDSFTYNLYHHLASLGAEVTVRRNDAISIDDPAHYDGLVLSPGPGLPHEAGIMMAVIERYASSKPILGICLGHQAIALHYGGRLVNLDQVLHGRALSTHIVAESVLYKGLSSPLQTGHYHSWVVDDDGLDQNMLITARTSEGYIMSMEHKHLPVFGIQYHPESILTPDGKAILNNWLQTLEE